MVERFEVVEVAVEPERTRLGVQHVWRADPVEERAAVEVREQAVAERAQPPDGGVRRHTGAVGEGHVDAVGGERNRGTGQRALRDVHDQRHVALAGAHVRERAHVQDLGGQGGDLVGRHQPGARPYQQHGLRDGGRDAQAPQRHRSNAARDVHHDVRRGGAERVRACGRAELVGLVV